MSLFIIFAKWLSITLADSLMSFTGIPSEPVALNELMILFMPWSVTCGKLNFLFCVTDDLIGVTFGWSCQVSMIFRTVVLLRTRFEESTNEDGLLTEDFLLY